jgi:hypothetical protein
MEILLRMVEIKDRLPQKTDNYWTNMGLFAYYEGESNFGTSSDAKKVKWWLEEIGISVVINIQNK